MNNRNLFKAIGGISDDLIAETANPVKKIKRLKVIRTAAIAAAVIAALGITSVATGVIVGSRTGSSWNIPDVLLLARQRDRKRRYRNRRPPYGFVLKRIYV